MIGVASFFVDHMRGTPKPGEPGEKILSLLLLDLFYVGEFRTVKGQMLACCILGSSGGIKYKFYVKWSWAKINTGLAKMCCAIPLG